MNPQLYERHLNRGTITFVCGTFLALGLVLAVVSVVTARDRWTAFGTPLGPDFSAMYVAGTVLNEHGPRELYNFALQDDVRRSVIPALPAHDVLPYLYAPWFAEFWRPLARIPYEGAFAIWLIVSLALFVAGFWCLSRVCTGLAPRDHRLALLIALSFEPFLFECWLNGQVSTFPFFCVCLSLWLHRQGRPVTAGMALSLCLYKPTLGILIFLLLPVGRHWRTMAGAIGGGVLLTALTIVRLGAAMPLEYFDALDWYRRQVAAGDIAPKVWKYVDLHSFSRLLSSDWQIPLTAVLLAGAAVMLLRLAALWRQAGPGWTADTQRAWAAALVSLPVLSGYFAVYDAILVIPGLMLAFDLRQRNPPGASRDAGQLAPAVALLYFAGAIAPVYETLRLNLFVPALLGLAWPLLRPRPSERLLPHLRASAQN